MSGEKRGFNPGERSESRSFLTRLHNSASRNIIIPIAAAIVGGGVSEGCSSRGVCPDGTSIDKSAEIFSGEQGQTISPSAQNSEVEDNEHRQSVDSRLSFSALEAELRAETKKDVLMAAELGRIAKSEAAVYYAVQYSATTAGLERKFNKVLVDKAYRERLDGFIRKYCEEFRVPYSIAYGIAANESGFNFGVESRVGAKGVFQVMDATASDKDLQLPGVSDLEKNVYAGIRYLSILYERYGQWSIAMMVYSTGPGNFTKKLRDKAGLDYQEEYGNDQGHWREFFEKYKINAVTLYSQEHYGLGGIHPFQYPFYVLAISELAERIMQGEFKLGKLPDLISPKEFRRTCNAYPNVIGRIKNKAGAANAEEIFRRLKIVN